jgi:glycosyltransferase involved in cell wall biosynthesis
MFVRALPMAKALAARGHSVTVLLPPWQNPEDAGKSWKENGVTIENIELPPRLPGLFHLLTALRLTRRALALHPDVVHLFKPKAYSGLTHWLLTKLPRRPRLVVDTDDWEGPGGWNETGGYTPVQRRFFTWQERWGLTHADAITVASRALESLVWAMGVSSRQVFYVPNGVGNQEIGIKSGRLEIGDRGTASDSPTILLYTRFFEFPVSRAIEVLCRVRERMPEVRLFIVGKGLFGEEGELFRLAEQRGLTVANLSPQLTNHESHQATKGLPDHVLRFTHDITYFGWVPLEILPTFFAQADVAIYPFDDTLINRTKCAVKLLDLLAARVPVVAEAVGQNREYIRHDETGLLIEPGNTEAFAEAVVQLLEDTPLREKLGKAAAHDVQERFAWDGLAEKVIQSYGRTTQKGS